MKNRVRKHGVAIIIAIFGCLTAHAADHHSALAAEHAFLAQYPAIHQYRIDVKGDTAIIKFKLNKRKCNAYYLSDGKWLRTEENIAVPWKWHLPEAVQRSWDRSSYASLYVDYVKQLDYPDSVSYIIRAHNELGPPESIPGDWVEVYILHFDPQGTIVKKEHWKTF